MSIPSSQNAFWVHTSDTPPFGPLWWHYFAHSLALLEHGAEITAAKQELPFTFTPVLTAVYVPVHLSPI